MNKWGVIIWFALLNIQCQMTKQLPTTNPNLSYISGVDTLLNWKENLLIDNRYANHEFPMKKGFSAVWKWKSQKNPYEQEKQQDTFRLPISSDLSDLLHAKRDGIFWLGHASFVIRINGIQFITDPVFKKAAIIKRWSKLPVEPKDLPPTNFVLLSHDHRDHCDKSSLKKLAKWNPNITYFTGLNMGKLVSNFLRGASGQEAGWYQQYQTEGLGFKLYFLPTRHWAKRGLTDTNLRLWGSFILEIGGLTIYFGGDSGYGSHYADIAKLFPKIDYAILGIGAYEPEWFMEDNHSSPQKAYQAFKDLGARYLIPMHYGTFDLSDEPIGKPQRELEKIKSVHQDTGIVIPVLGANLLQP